jgi:hypothetical protein
VTARKRARQRPRANPIKIMIDALGLIWLGKAASFRIV